MLAYWLALACYALIVAPAHELPLSCYLPAISVTLLAVAFGAALALLPGVPVVLAVCGNLALGGIIFARWGAASLGAGGYFSRRAR